MTVDAFIADVAQSQLGWPESLRFTYEKTLELLYDGIEGDLVECGVAAGVHPAMFDRACTDAGVDRTIRLFDSFQGLPHGGPNDLDWNEHWGNGSGELEPTGVAKVTLDEVQANLQRWGCDGRRFAFHPGWFQHTLPKIAEAWAAGGAIAFLRLDGDLYASTLVCLQHLYPLVSPGGIVVIDDLNLDGCRAAVHDYGLDPDAFAVVTDSGDGWIVKP